MQLFELEISNFKCLDNSVMPLRFTNLNLLIGGNDSGKTSLFEAIRIVLNEKEIQSNMFFNPDKDVSIIAKFTNINPKILEDALTIQDIELSHIEYLNNYDNTGNPFTNADGEKYNGRINLNYFKDYISKYLKKFSFYNDLKNFYNEYISNFLITVDKTFSLKDQGNIEVEETIFFDLKNTRILNKLLDNNDFIAFMVEYTEKFHKKCEELMQAIVKKENFSFNKLNGNLDRMEFDIYDLDENGNIVGNNEKYTKEILKLHRLINSLIFSDDDEEMVLSKIANLIAIFINCINCEKVNWDIGGFIKHPDITDAKIANTMRQRGLRINYMENIINNTIGIIDENEVIDEFKLPGVKLFDIAIINEKIPYQFFDDLFKSKAIKEVISDELSQIAKKEFIRDSVGDFLLEKGLANKYFIDGINNNIKNYMHSLDEVLDDLNIRFDFSESFYEKLKDIIELNVKIEIKEKLKDIDITQKGQGFLNKLMISDFLLLVKGYEELTTGEATDKELIILIEEPESHLHYDAQIKVLEILKDNLNTSSTQVFVTTHSESIIEYIDFGNIYVFSKDKNTGLSSIEFGSSGILNAIQKSLGLSKRKILIYKKLAVLVEGKRDIVFFESLCKKAELRINFERILFVPVHGQEKMDYYVKNEIISDPIGLKKLVILDNNDTNRKRKKELLENEDVIDVILIDKKDILDYIDIEIVEEYFGLKRNTLRYDKTKDKLEKVVQNYIRRNIKDDDIEEMALRIKEIPSELKRILDKIKFVQDTYTGFNF